MKKISTSIALFMFMVLVVNSTLVFAKTSRTVTISAVSGTVTVDKGSGSTVSGASGTKLAAGYTVATASGASCTLKFDDGSTSKMAASSKVKVDNASSGTLSVSVLSGSLSVDAAAQSSGNSVQVKGGNSALAVRGTLFVAEYNKHGQFIITMLEGAADLDGSPVTTRERMVVYDSGSQKEYDKEPLTLDSSLSLHTLNTLSEHKDELIEKGIFTADELEKLPELIEQKKEEEARQEAETVAPPDTEEVHYYVEEEQQGNSGGGGGSTPTLHTVTYHANGAVGSAPAAATIYSGTSFTAPTAPGLSIVGKQMAEWNTEADGSGRAYAIGSTIVMPARELNLYAIWEFIDYPVTYHANGGSGSVPVQSDLHMGDSFTAPAAPGLSFTGKQLTQWNTAANGSGTSYSVGSSITMPANGLDLYAIWEFVDYTVTYSANGGSGTVPTQTDQHYGDTFIAASGAALTAPSGKVFDGWNTAANGSGTAYATGSSVTMPAENLTLYAVWATSVASIGSVQYKSLADALLAAGSGDTIIIEANTEIPSGTTATLAAGATLSIPAGKTVTVNGTLTIVPSAIVSSAGALIINSGNSLNVDGTLSVQRVENTENGKITVSPTGVVNVVEGFVNNGLLDFQGTLTFDAGAWIDFTADGTLSSSNSLPSYLLDTSGTPVTDNDDIKGNVFTSASGGSSAQAGVLEYVADDGSRKYYTSLNDAVMDLGISNPIEIRVRESYAESSFSLNLDANWTYTISEGKTVDVLPSSSASNIFGDLILEEDATLSVNYRIWLGPEATLTLNDGSTLNSAVDIQESGVMQATNADFTGTITLGQASGTPTPGTLIFSGGTITIPTGNEIENKGIIELTDTDVVLGAEWGNYPNSTATLSGGSVTIQSGTGDLKNCGTMEITDTTVVVEGELRNGTGDVEPGTFIFNSGSLNDGSSGTVSNIEGSMSFNGGTVRFDRGIDMAPDMLDTTLYIAPGVDFSYIAASTFDFFDASGAVLNSADVPGYTYIPAGAIGGVVGQDGWLRIDNARMLRSLAAPIPAEPTTPESDPAENPAIEPGNEPAAEITQGNEPAGEQQAEPQVEPQVEPPTEPMPEPPANPADPQPPLPADPEEIGTPK